LTPALRAAAAAAVVLVLDQGTKALVRSEVEPGSRQDLLPGVDLVHTKNTGVAFSLLQGGGTVLIVFTIVAIVALLAYFARDPDRAWVWLPTGLLVGGSAGNLIDRVLEGSVTDFVDLPLWPAFNVADMAITFGVVALLFVLERPRERV
jgi:signal peptidase II